MRGSVLLAAIAAIALLPGCGQKKVTCDAQGLIVIPADASLEDRSDWLAENRELLFKRLALETGDPNARYYPPATLEKAPSCP